MISLATVGRGFAICDTIGYQILQDLYPPIVSILHTVLLACDKLSEYPEILMALVSSNFQEAKKIDITEVCVMYSHPTTATKYQLIT